MEVKSINLWENGAPFFKEEFGQEQPSLTPYLTDSKETRGCVIVIPGGGYAMRAVDHEGTQIAKMINEAGINAFVLNYRYAPYRHPVELGDALRAIRWVRFHAQKYNINPNKIGILGFSAGGHLTVSASEHFDYGIENGDPIDKVSSRPDAAVYCYAVCSLEKPFSHFGSRDNLLGKDFDPKLAKSLSGEESVREDMPPAFFWHTFEDEAVPVENSLAMAMAMRKKKIPVEMHIFPEGKHGLGLAPEIPHTAQWATLLKKWLLKYGF